VATRVGSVGSSRTIGRQWIGTADRNQSLWNGPFRIIPEDVTFAQAATLPVAGLTALYALERGGFRLNRKVLVTRASGGVSHFACQLAQQSGATITALVRREERAASLRVIGVHKVVIGEDVVVARSSGPYDVIVDTLGGKSSKYCFDFSRIRWPLC
jgi:NADPH:quinone reductase-like Zn-dependent oxidoreductase